MLSIQYGERFDYLFSRILYSRRSLDEEAEELFHNTEALMKCYCTILWRYGEDDLMEFLPTVPKGYTRYRWYGPEGVA